MWMCVHFSEHFSYWNGFCRRLDVLDVDVTVTVSLRTNNNSGDYCAEVVAISSGVLVLSASA